MHGLPAKRSAHAGWPTQAPTPSQASPAVQLSRSLHATPAGAGSATQPMSGSQVVIMHGLLGSQVVGR